MADIVERLHLTAEDIHVPPEVSEECREAAAEIERLRGALREIEKGAGPYSRDQLTHATNCIEHMIYIARRALQGEP